MHECTHCGARYVAPHGNQRYCSARCKHAAAWAKRARRMCARCGAATGWTLTDRRGGEVVLCNPCSRAECGTTSAYQRGCRCPDCTEAKRLQMRDYTLMVKERDGLTPTQKHRPRRSAGVKCNLCGEPLERLGPLGRCTPCSRPSLGHWISDKDRLAIYERDGWVCQICMKPVDRNAAAQDRLAPTLDHIECRSWVLIPDDRPENLRTAHRACNSARGNSA